MICLHNTTCFTLDCAAIVSFTNPLPWRLYKRPKCMNYHKLAESRWICNASRPWPGAVDLLPRSHRSARAMSQIPCHLVSLHHHDPRFYRANAYSMVRLTATTIYTMPLQCKAPELFILFLIGEAVMRNNAGYEDVVQDKLCHSRHLSASLCRTIDKSLFLHLQ